MQIPTKPHCYIQVSSLFSIIYFISRFIVQYKSRQALLSSHPLLNSQKQTQSYFLSVFYPPSCSTHSLLLEILIASKQARHKNNNNNRHGKHH
ncbi:hypothetical protein BX070DRAFT_70526 [Coemansia spiralis]|nr:hypothetical protein BX070DRAFT_70526 [Coemansia spiralis]